MKHPPARPSATSLPTSPEEVAAARSRRYLIIMAVRVACFVLMVVITPYGWYTALLGIGAIFLPYVAVVVANVGQEAPVAVSENPERALTEKPASAPTPTSPNVIQVHETIQVHESPPRDGRTGSDA